jgi:hypothetical protein
LQKLRQAETQVVVLNSHWQGWRLAGGLPQHTRLFLGQPMDQVQQHSTWG